MIATTATFVKSELSHTSRAQLAQYALPVTDVTEEHTDIQMPVGHKTYHDAFDDCEREHAVVACNTPGTQQQPNGASATAPLEGCSLCLQRCRMEDEISLHGYSTAAPWEI